MGATLCNDVDAHDLLVDPLNQNNQFDYHQEDWPKNKYLQQLLQNSTVAPGDKKVMPYKHAYLNRYYWGGWSNGKPYGKGIIYNNQPNKKIYYQGEVNGQPNGKGIVVFNDGQWRYEGQINNSQAHGKGKMVNKKHGYQFDGQWQNSKPKKGIIIFHQLNTQAPQSAKGDIIIDFDDAQHDNTIRYPDGRVYVGQIDKKRFIPHGIGNVTFPDKKQYIGQWHNGEMHGAGKYIWEDGSMYSGQYMFGKRHGKGKYVFSNGKYYDGQWSEGKQNGQGKLYSKQGSILKQGIWKQGQIVSD